MLHPRPELRILLNMDDDMVARKRLVLLSDPSYCVSCILAAFRRHSLAFEVKSLVDHHVEVLHSTLQWDCVYSNGDLEPPNLFTVSDQHRFILRQLQLNPSH